MKTLKKTLCLVLAVVMVVGVLVLPANAATTTTEDTDATAAFKTLNTYGVMNGVDANNTPALDKNINRQDMAAIIYRIMTGDTANKYVDNYASAANEFADSATFATWAKGYIGYVRNQGIFVGDNKGNFKPTEEIAGSDVLTVLLRCIGYGKNDEFTGPNYAQNALTQATQIHMFGGVDGYKSVAEKAMDKPISRGAVAKLTFNAVQAPMVTYFNGTYSAYSTQGRPAAPNDPAATKNPTLISYNPAKETAFSDDDWGIPTVKITSELSFNTPIPAVTIKKTTSESTPVKEYWTAVTQCDLAEDLGLEAETTFTVYVNGKANKTSIDVVPTNTVAQIGAQGRHTLVFDVNTADTQVADTIVYIDTLLAEVTSVVAPTFDAKGHLKTSAKLSMTVYTKEGGEQVTQEKSDGTTYAYAKGDMLLVNYIQNGLNGTSNVDVSGTDGGYGDTVKGTDAAAKGKNVKIVDKATAFDGKQTTIYYNQNKHKIDNVDYNDNNRFHLNEASTNGGTYTWYLDTKGNLIGSKLIKSEASFGVITRIWAEISNGTTSVKANVTYVDGRTATLDVATIVTDDVDTSSTYTHKHLGTAVSNASDLKWAPATYLNASSKTPMTYETNTAFYVSNSYEENLTADKVIGDSTKTNHIIGANLFKIVASGSKYNFIEVIGGTGNVDLDTTAPGIDYRGMGSASTDMVPNKVANGAVVANDSTRYLIKTGGTGTDANPFTFETKVGYTNIVEYGIGEVDYADVDGDGYADVVYITAAPKAASGDHIFFSEAVLKTDKGGNTWELHKSYDTTSGITTVYGWVDGVYGAVQVKSDATSSLDTTPFDAFVTNATGNQLWLVTVTDGLVKDIDGKRSDNTAVNATVGSNLFGSGTNALDDGTNGMNTPGAYTGMKLFVYTSTGTPKTEEVNGTTLKLGDGKYFNIATLKDKPTVGDWADVLVKDTVVYVVYNGANVVTQAYVVSLADGSGYTTPTTPAPATVDGEITDPTTIQFNGTTVYSGKGWKEAADAIKNATSISFAGQLMNAETTKVFVKNTSFASSGEASYEAYISEAIMNSAVKTSGDSAGSGALVNKIEASSVKTGAEGTNAVTLNTGYYVVVRLDNGTNVDWFAFKIV